MENFNGVKIYDWTPKESDCEKKVAITRRWKREEKKNLHINPDIQEKKGMKKEVSTQYSALAVDEPPIKPEPTSLAGLHPILGQLNSGKLM